MNIAQRIDSWRVDLERLDPNCRDMLGLLSRFCREWDLRYEVYLTSTNASPMCKISGVNIVYGAGDTERHAIHDAMRKFVPHLSKTVLARTEFNVIKIDVLVDKDQDVGGFVKLAKEKLGPYVAGFHIVYGGTQHGVDGYED